MLLTLCAERFAFLRLRREGQHLESHRLGQAQHDVHILDGLARCTLDKIIDGRYHDHATILFAHADSD